MKENLIDQITDILYSDNLDLSKKELVLFQSSDFLLKNYSAIQDINLKKIIKQNMFWLILINRDILTTILLLNILLISLLIDFYKIPLASLFLLGSMIIMLVFIFFILKQTKENLQKSIKVLFS